jgi:hypothetical protein
MLFMGKNGSGKSTLIQAMSGGFNSKLLPTETIRKGQQRAKISHTIAGKVAGEEKEYIIDIYFTEKDQKGRLVITNEKGETMKSPSTLIKTIIGNVSFDVTKWISDSKDNKLKTLKALTGKGKEIDLKNLEIKEVKEKIKMKKARAEDLEGALKNHEFKAEEVELYSVPVDMKPIQEEMANVAKNQKQWDDVANKVKGFAESVERSKTTISKNEQDVAELEEKLHKLREGIAFEKGEILKNEQNITLGKEWLAKVPRPEMEAVNQKMNSAIQHNEKHGRIGMLGQQQREMIATKNEVEQLKLNVEKLESERNDLISKSQLSIPGLSFSDEEVFIDGLPLEEGQVNSERLINIGVDVAMALNPNLKIIFINDGSLLDGEHLKVIVDKIEANGYQAIIELVDFAGGELECKFTEEALG